MSLYDYEEVKVVHLELTSKCNALCPMCSRSVHGARVNPNLKLAELSLEDIRRIFPTKFVKQLYSVVLCGNYGDPALASELPNILSWFRKLNSNIAFHFATNGGVRPSEWWKELAQFFTKNSSQVYFGIDGLEDTNHLYRINVKWDKLMENVHSFIRGGGRAVWHFIVFKHNEHQVERARTLSKEMGFIYFEAKETARFQATGWRVGGETLIAEVVYDRNLKFSHFLEAPSKKNIPQWYPKDAKSVDLSQYAKLLKENGTTLKTNNLSPSFLKERRLSDDERLNRGDKKCSVKCFVKKEKSIFINYLGQVFPCCWTAWPYHFWHGHLLTREIREIIDNLGGECEIDGKSLELKKIVEGKFFDLIAQGIDEKKESSPLYACQFTCGEAGLKGV